MRLERALFIKNEANKGDPDDPPKDAQAEEDQAEVE
jgi:hypothetical protein